MSEPRGLPAPPSEAHEDAVWAQVVQASAALEAAKRLLVAAQEDRGADHAAAASQVRLARAAFDAVFSEWQELRWEIRRARKAGNAGAGVVPDADDA